MVNRQAARKLLRALREGKGGGGNPDQPRHPKGSPEGGQFAPKGAVASGAGVAGVASSGLPASAHRKPGMTTTKPDGTVVTSNVYLAARILARGGKVELQSTRQVSTLLDKLARQVDRAARLGAKAPNIDLCNVSVKGTNLFCAESKGIPRIEMPQLSGWPRPGSQAATLPKTREGGVDAAPVFVSWLAARGIGTTNGTELSSHLKASQGELIGTKVAGMVRAAREGKFDPGEQPIFVSRDNYVIDGHHRWATQIGVDAADGHLGDMRSNVQRLDADIVTALGMARQFADEFGILPAAAKVKEALRRYVRLRRARLTSAR